MKRKFGKTAIFHFWTKAMLSLNPFSLEILWKRGTYKKNNNETLNGCISNARANSGSKLICSESLFNFLQNNVVFASSTHVGTWQRDSAPYNPRCPWQRLAGLKKLSLISGKNIWNVSIKYMYVASTLRKQTWLLF